MIRLNQSFTPVIRFPLFALLLLLLLAYAGAARPVSATAFFFDVDNNGDASGQPCTIAVNDCSLRSAMEHANANPGSTVDFNSSYTIVLGSALPTITAAGTKITAVGQSVFINANNVTRAFDISADDVQIDNLDMGGTKAGLSTIYIEGSAVRIKISNNGNHRFPGPCGASNNYGGIYVNSTGGTLGLGQARVWIYGNRIECNNGTPGDGITLDGTDNVMIGEDAAHNAVPNSIDQNNSGIRMINSAALNNVRNSTIDQNNGKGIWINNSSLNIVQASTITRQGFSGVWIDGGSFGNRIGSPLGGPATAGNVISGNTGNGVYISDAATSGNLVYGNFIGTDNKGITASPNGGDGVMLDNGSHDNLIGATASERNIISGNTGDGVFLQNGAYNNLVRGNFIGTNISGTVALPNQNGIEIVNGAYRNTVGGATANANEIAGNLSDGIRIDGGRTATNTITSNYVGATFNTVESLPNGLDNIALASGTHANVIGGENVPNLVYNAGRSGIDITSGSFGNHILVNNVGVSGQYGILLDGVNTSNNVISRTAVFENGQTCPGCDGIGERDGASYNTWTQISTYANAGLGIDKFITNDATNIVNPPNLTITSVNKVTGVVSGIADGTTGSASTVVELYRLALDPRGYGEGVHFVGSTFTDFNGQWNITDPDIASNAPCYTAFVTRDILPGMYSSEFSRSNCSLFLPLIRR